MNEAVLFPDGDDPDCCVSYARHGHLAEVVLARPAKLNALNARMLDGLRLALRHFDDDQEAWVCILSGGGRAFSTGADVGERQNLPFDEQRRTGGPGRRGPMTMGFLYECVNWKPVIAVVHGYAFGMALSLAMEADFCVMADDAQLEVTETSRGLWGHFHWLRMHARGATTFADDVAMTGRRFSGREAKEARIVSHASTAEDGLQVAKELADQLVSVPPLAVRAVTHARRMTLKRAEADYEVFRVAHPLHLTEDFQHSARAFVEKRPPSPFVGR